VPKRQLTNFGGPPRQQLRRISLLVPAMLVVVGWFTYVAPAVAQPAEDVSVDDPRPLADIARRVERRCRCAVSYEDQKWSRDQVTPSMFARRRPDGSTTLVPRGIPLRVTLSRDLAQKDRASVFGGLQSIMATYNGSLHMGEFALADDGRMFHIRPSSPSPLDSVLTISRRNVTLQQAVDMLTTATSDATGEKVVVAMSPNNLFVQSTTDLVADGEPARDILSRILLGTKRSLSFQMLYDFDSARYFLSIYFIP
jgi:hypothetical protein